jgi:hypothetical protein
MSLMNDIRAQMGRESGPVTAAQISEALDVDAVKVRNAMYQASKQDAGIERHDDGTYSLVPGWKPGRAAETATPTTPSSRTPKAAAKKPKSQKAAATVRAKAGTKPKRAYTRKGSPPSAANAIDTSRPALPVDSEYVRISRTSLALLVEGVLDGNAPIAGALRGALREATSHALPF